MKKKKAIKHSSIKVYASTLEQVKDAIKNDDSMSIIRFYDLAVKEKLKNKK